MFRIIIVDDEPAIVDGIAHLLESSKLPFREIKRAYSALDVIDYLDKTTIDLAIVDIRMPEMNGLQLCERIKQQCPRSKVIFLTGFTDFEYVRTAMKMGSRDYLLKPADDEELLTCLQRAIAELEEELNQMLSLESANRKAKEAIPSVYGDFFRYMLEFDEQLTPQAIQFRMAESNLPLSYKDGLITCIVRVDEWQERFQPCDEALIQFAVQNMVDEMVTGTGQTLSFRHDNGLLVVLLQAKPEVESKVELLKLNDFLQEVQDTIYRVLGVLISIVYTAQYLPWNAWAKGFRSLLAYLQQYAGKGRLASCDLQVVQVKPINLTDFHESLARLIKAMDDRDVIAFESLLQPLLYQENAANSEEPRNLAFIYLELSRHMMNIALRHQVGHLFDARTMEYMTNLYKHKGPQSIHNFMVETLQRIIAEISVNDTNPTIKLVEEVKHYIRTHLSEDLSLDALALRAHLNASYLSRVFYQFNGENISGFIARKRMEHAKHILLTEDDRIHEVAERVGFDNPNYFAKVFRKTFGLSPHEFRNLHSNSLE